MSTQVAKGRLVSTSSATSFTREPAAVRGAVTPTGITLILHLYLRK